MEEKKLAQTTFTDKLIEAKSRKYISFHALPINRLRSVKNSILLEKYQEVFGEQYTQSEVTYTGNVMDNPVAPHGILKESQEATAKAFGAKTTYYVTVGTTISNFVAILGSVAPNERVLADRNTHQSIHFALKLNNNLVDYSTKFRATADSGREMMDVDAFIAKYKAAYDEGKPYKLVILNGCSYEGIMYELEELIEACLKINDKVIFFIDEAWCAYGYFHPFYKRFTAMNVANVLSKKYPEYEVNIICTQSAHKSLSTLRQGSLIHINASDEVTERIWKYKYMLHTTSPNYPIIASLELARAQMVLEGEGLIESTLEKSKKIRSAVKKLKRIYINEDQATKWSFIDPCKVSINFSKLKVPISSINDFLLSKGIYANRKTKTSILFNIHIGLSDRDIDKLIRVLQEIDKKTFFKCTKSGEKTYDYYLMSYPPGTPVVVPGDKVSEVCEKKIEKLKSSGVSVIRIDK